MAGSPTTDMAVTCPGLAIGNKVKTGVNANSGKNLSSSSSYKIPTDRSRGKDRAVL